ncbi:MAG: TIR domain-containing protein [Nannocystaceae bacterium]
MSRVATFYSYKGGVGRTFLLANVAVLLAKWGKKVLCVDWDLEAPGLLHYFSTAAKDVKGGVVDIVAAAASDESVRWQDMIVQIEGNEDGRIDLLPAGAPGDAYVRTMQGLDWKRLYEQHELGWLIEQMRTEWLAEYDLVLVDSRTGLTDIGGICVAQLPDILVVLSSANAQSLDGCLDVIERAREARDKLPIPRPSPLILPLASRFDEREEYDDANAWLDRFSEAWAPSYRAWAVEGTEPRELLTLLRIPYISKWSFGERLPARRERIDDPGLISWSIANVAACLDQGLGDADLLVSNRNAYVKRSGRSAIDSDLLSSYPKGDVFIAHNPNDESIARALHAELVQRGLEAFATFAIRPGDSVIDAMEHAVDRNGVVALLVTDTSEGTAWAREEYLSILLDPAVRVRRPIIPVYVGKPNPNELPIMLRAIVGITTDGDMGLVADRIADVVARHAEGG